MTRAVAIVLVILSMFAAGPAISEDRTPWGCDENDGAPFGQVGEDESRGLMVFAHNNGLELKPKLDQVYSGDSKALESVLRFSMQFRRLDGPARTYGNMVYSIFLNLGERKAPGVFIPVVSAQDPAVRQRIRDILWHPLLCEPAENRTEGERLSRQKWPSIWPSDYVFGRGDSVFGETPDSDLKPRGL